MELSRAYGWTPDEIARMNFYQIAFYLGMPVPGMGKVQLTQQQFQHWFGGIQGQRMMQHGG